MSFRRVAGFNRRTFLQLTSAALCAPRLARAATFVRQPYLQNVQADRASVLWTTQQAGAGTVTLTGSDGSPVTVPAAMKTFQPSDTQLPAAFYQYQADFMGLQPGTTYSYQVTVDGQTMGLDPTQFRFRTAPKALAGRFSFLAFGDSGADSPEQQTLVKLMAAEMNASMVLHAGDMAYPDGTFAEFESAYYGVNAPLMRRMGFFSTPGNHEYNTNFAAPYLAGTSVPQTGVPATGQGRYYSFDWSNVHFVALDSNLLATSSASDMLGWLDADLGATDQYWQIVFLHHTPYPTGFHLGDPICAAVQQLVNPIVERHGVHLVLAGHEHGYERTHPLAGGEVVGPAASATTYIVTGGGGGALESVGSSAQCALSVQAFNYVRVDIDGTELTLTAIGLEGGEIDQLILGSTKKLRVHSVLSKGDNTPAIAAGSLVAISGQNMALRSAESQSYPLPTGLSGVTVRVGGQAAPLLSVSATQIHAQIPYEVSGPVSVEVSTPNGFASANIVVSATAPSLLAIVSHEALFSSLNSARPGDDVTLYVTGLGEVQGGIESGTAPSRSIPVKAPVEVWLGRIRLQPKFAGLAPDLAGVYAVGIAIPRELPDGVYSVHVIAGGVSSRPANLDIAASGVGERNDRALLKVHTRASS